MSSSNSTSSSGDPPTTTTSTPTPSSSTSSTPPPSTSTSTTPPTTSTTPTSTSTTPTSTPSSSSPPVVVSTSVVTPTPGVTSTIVVTSTKVSTDSSTGTTSSTTTTPTVTDSNGAGTSSWNNGGKIAVAVVVPIAAVALLVVAGLFLWRKRKQRKDLEEQRRKEVEDYGYNPNADPTIPNVGGAAGAVAAGSYEAKDDGSSGYRGWGSTTLAGSTGRKASTTMSGGGGGGAYSDITPPRGNMSDTRSAELHDTSHSPEGEILGAMGPSAAANRNDMRRGPSNASSSYSGVARSEGSDGGQIGMAYSGGPGYYDQYGNGNPYNEAAYGSPPRPSELAGQPVIRDNPARRNTRIESPSHFPEQSAGISRNF